MTVKAFLKGIGEQKITTTPEPYEWDSEYGQSVGRLSDNLYALARTEPRRDVRLESLNQTLMQVVVDIFGQSVADEFAMEFQNLVDDVITPAIKKLGVD